ncbi:MAG: hypothetical protein HUJ96_04195 [Marinilabiliaceae bacterium]|mgnify:CR=1 FL=1|nr:hypothetical protein [Marinilabiliaceae bacterium]
MKTLIVKAVVMTIVILAVGIDGTAQGRNNRTTTRRQTTTYAAPAPAKSHAAPKPADGKMHKPDMKAPQFQAPAPKPHAPVPAHKPAPKHGGHAMGGHPAPHFIAPVCNCHHCRPYMTHHYTIGEIVATLPCEYTRVYINGNLFFKALGMMLSPVFVDGALQYMVMQ